MRQDDTLDTYLILMGAKALIEGNLTSAMLMFSQQKLDLVEHDMRGIIRAAQMVIDQIEKPGPKENS